MEDEEYKKIVEKSIQYRGRILHEISIMEVILNAYISHFFCSNPDRILDMELLILGDDRIALSAKAQIFNFIATEYDNNWFLNYKSLRPKQVKKPEFNLNQDLNFVIEERNIFAHRVIDHDLLERTNPRDKNHIRLIKLKNQIQPLDYDDVKIDFIISIIKSITKYLGQKLFPKNTQPASA